MFVDICKVHVLIFLQNVCNDMLEEESDSERTLLRKFIKNTEKNKPGRTCEWPEDIVNDKYKENY